MTTLPQECFALTPSPADPQPVKHVRCPVCGYPLEVTGDVYPAHKMMKFGSAGISHGHPCPRSEKPFDPLAPPMAVPLPWDSGR